MPRVTQPVRVSFLVTVAASLCNSGILSWPAPLAAGLNVSDMASRASAEQLFSIDFSRVRITEVTLACPVR
jgi:hypothetical protein